MESIERAAQDAETALKAAMRCWKAWRTLMDQELIVDGAVPSISILRGIDESTSALDVSANLLAGSLGESGDVFEAIAREPYDAGPVQAGSAHRATLKLAQFYLAESRHLLDEYLSGEPPLDWAGEDPRREQFAFRLRFLVDVHEVDAGGLAAELEWERGKTSTEAMPEARSEPQIDSDEPTDELLGAQSGELRGHARLILNCLARHRRRSVSVADLRRIVWDESAGVVTDHDKKAVSTAVSALRKRLRGLNHAVLAGQIQWNGSGYTLR